MSRVCIRWTKEMDDFLREHYPLEGKMWCVEAMGVTEPMVRSRASKLRLSAIHTSRAVAERNAAHSDKLRGRKRPDQALVMRRLHAEGKLVQSNESRVEAGRRLSEKLKSGELVHPRGMLGKKHTAETLQVVSRSSKEWWANATEEQIVERTMKQLKTRDARSAGTERFNPHGKWKAAWREVGGKRAYFRSSWEANYGRYLQFMKEAGLIAEWEHEPVTFWFEGVKRGSVSYLPDFRVTNKDGSIEYHEVKGWMDARSRTKIARMAKYHPEVRLIVIDSQRYKAIATKAKLVIGGWE